MIISFSALIRSCDIIVTSETQDKWTYIYAIETATACSTVAVTVALHNTASSIESSTNILHVYIFIRTFAYFSYVMWPSVD